MPIALIGNLWFTGSSAMDVMEHYSTLIYNFVDYSDTKVMRILNSELADTLGNLLSRACAKSVNRRHVFPTLDKSVFDELIQADTTKKLVHLVEGLPGEFVYCNKKNLFQFWLFGATI